MTDSVGYGPDTNSAPGPLDHQPGSQYYPPPYDAVARPVSTGVRRPPDIAAERGLSSPWRRLGAAGSAWDEAR